MKKYSIDENLFKNIDCEWKAYFLGLMYADGNIQKDMYRATLALSEKDKPILDTLLFHIYGENSKQLERRQSTTQIKNGISHVGNPQYSLRINNTKIVRDLIEKGCIPKKTFTLRFPTQKQVPVLFVYHFIRGYFDGDGWVKSRKGRSGEIGLLGTENFLQVIQQILQINDIKSTIKKVGNIYGLYIYKTTDILKVFNLFYSTATIYLDRKYQKMKLISDNWVKATSTNKSSKFKGVKFNKRLGKWNATASINGIRKWLGTFDTEIEAYQARQKELQ